MKRLEKYLPVIRPNDVLKVILPARCIPHDARVTKRTGEKFYRLRHDIRVFPEDRTKEEGLTLNGYFLVHDGDINTLSPETLLVWYTSAEEFVDNLTDAWQSDR